MTLPLLILLPLAAAVVLAFMPKERPEAARTFALVASLAVAAASLLLYPATARLEAGQLALVADRAWFSAGGVDFRLSFGADALSMWLALCTTLIAPLVVLGAWDSVRVHAREYLACLLALESAMLGTVFVQDLLLFYVFWEMMLLPSVVLIAVWGGAGRRKAAALFFLFTLAGSLAMLAALLDLGSTYGSMDLRRLPGLIAAQGGGGSTWLFLAFAAAFAVKLPVFPLHRWIPEAHPEAPVIAGVMLKFGAFGFLRIAIPCFPQAAQQLAPVFCALAVAGLVWGALAALVQDDARRLVAYSSLSHMGYVTLGIFCGDPRAFSGAVLQMVAHSFSTGALFLLLTFVETRTGTRSLRQLGGLAGKTPLLAFCLVVAGLSTAALPGTAGFAAEFLVLFGAFQADPLLGALAASGVVLGIAYTLRLLRGPLFGPEGPRCGGVVPDLGFREALAVLPCLFVIVLLGLRPLPVTASVERAAAQHAAVFAAPAAAAAPGKDGR